MAKAFVGPRLRQLRRERNQTQAQMAKQLGVSPAYVTLMETNQRSLSVRMLMALSDAYGVDWRDLLKDDAATHLADLRNALQDPVFRGERPDLQELRAALDHAPRLVEAFLDLQKRYRGLVDSVTRGGAGALPPELLGQSLESLIHDFFRDHRNHFPVLERLAEDVRAEERFDGDDTYGLLKARLAGRHGITLRIEPVDRLPDTLRVFDRDLGELRLSEALDHANRVFQLAHVLGLVEGADTIEAQVRHSEIGEERGRARLRVELANYFAAALLMPYDPVLRAAESSRYDIDMIAARFGTSFEQVCHRLTTLQREGALGVPFFFLRVDKAGNVTKRFNSTSFHLADHGGSCPRWNIHMAFRNPDVILPQFVELPDGARYFTLSRTVNRPVFSRDTQDMRLAVGLGCVIGEAGRIGYADGFDLSDPGPVTPIGINCQICPRLGCTQRAYQPLHIELPIDADRRGATRLES